MGCVENVPESPVVPLALHAMRRHHYSLSFLTWMIQGILEHESADASGIISRVSFVKLKQSHCLLVLSDLDASLLDRPMTVFCSSCPSALSSRAERVRP